MLQDRIEWIGQWLKRVVTQPLDELNKWQKTVRSCYDLGRFGARQLQEDRAQHMAAALSFRTLFSLLPVLVVTTLLVRGVIPPERIMEWVDILLAKAKLDTLSIREGESLSEWIKTLLGEASNVNLGAIGWVGTAVMLYAAISLLVTIENCFNVIVRSPGGRRWNRRVTLYWFVLTASPLAVCLWFVVNQGFDLWISSIRDWKLLVYMIGLIWELFFSWLLLFAVYTLMPNTTPKLRPAAVGAIVAAVLLVLGLRSFLAFLNFDNSVSIGRLSHSLGLIPLFMFWVYLMWLVMLFGLEVCAILQALPGRQLQELEQKRKTKGLVDPATVLVLMEAIGRRFRDGQPTSLRQLCESTGLSEPIVSHMISGLVMENLLHRLDGPEETVALARPPEMISGTQLLKVAYRLVQQDDLVERSSLLERLRQAQHDLVAHSTLAAIVAEPHTAASE